MAGFFNRDADEFLGSLQAGFEDADESILLHVNRGGGSLFMMIR